jgi:arginyl-tRNA synthetase
MLKEEIKKIISGVVGEDIDLLSPKNNQFGDYSVNINRLNHKIDINKFENKYFEKIEEKSGFINFYLSRDTLLNNLSEDTLFPKTELTALFEFGQPNTHKLPHIGHLFSYIYGESCSRLLEFTGNRIVRLNYQGDIGLHVAKCLYIVTKKKQEIERLQSLEEKINFLQTCYQEGSMIYEDKEAKMSIDELNTKIYEKNSEIFDLWKTTRQWSIDYYQKFEETINIKYQRSYFESETFEIGKKIVNENVGKIFEKSEGAIIFDGEPYGLHKRVFINSLGNPTYEGKDIGLMSLKIKDWQFNKCIVTTANEQNEYWKVIKTASELIFPEIKDKITHLGFGMINLKSGKMSSREGKIISAINLIDEVKNKIIEKYPDTNIEIIEKIALSAIKYSFLKSEAKKNIIFDIEESISLHGNSGPYIQYAHTRCQSLLRNCEVKDYDQKALDLSLEEMNLLRHLVVFENIVESSARLFSPHLLCNYLYELAKLFSVFYEKMPILKAPENSKFFRLSLVKKTKEIICQSLSLLGIEALDKI